MAYIDKKLPPIFVSPWTQPIPINKYFFNLKNNFSKLENLCLLRISIEEKINKKATKIVKSKRCLNFKAKIKNFVLNPLSPTRPFNPPRPNTQRATQKTDPGPPRPPTPLKSKNDSHAWKLMEGPIRLWGPCKTQRPMCTVSLGQLKISQKIIKQTNKHIF